jgi:hypothetical protein
MRLGNPIRWTDPTTWPWSVYFWLAVIAGGFLKRGWHRLQQTRATNWLRAEGRVELADVGEKDWWDLSADFRGRSARNVAALGYSYRVAGTVYSGTYKREFLIENEAWEFARRLKGGQVIVQYNPDKPSDSILLEPID